MSEYVDLVSKDGQVLYPNIARTSVGNYPDAHMQIVIAVITNASGHVLIHRRAQTKRVNPGDIDHVCGSILAGESPEAAARRECFEETGVKLDRIIPVRTGINQYNRYCHLFRGSTSQAPAKDLDPAEVAWARFAPIMELHAKHTRGEYTFVDGFFEDLAHALAI